MKKKMEIKYGRIHTFYKNCHDSNNKIKKKKKKVGRFQSVVVFFVI